jgi:hypothetical protein
MNLWYVWCKPCTYLAPIQTLPSNGLKRVSTWPTSPRSSIGCIQNNIRAYGTFGANRAPILLQYKECLQMDQNEIPQDPRYLAVLLSVSKMISKPVVCSAQTSTYLAPIQTLPPNGLKRDSTWPMSPRSSIDCVQNNIRAYGTFGTNHAPILH